MIDLAPLPHLKDLAADWQQVADTISTATRLTSLNASRFSEPNLEPLSTLTGLENLALADRPRVRSLEGLAAFQELRRLVVAPARSLHDVSALAFARHLERLDLEGARRLATLDTLGDCVSLKWLNISECGPVASLSPLAHLDQLEALHAHGNTNITDGELGVLLQLRSLREVRMQARRHYKPSLAQVQTHLPAVE